MFPDCEAREPVGDGRVRQVASASRLALLLRVGRGCFAHRLAEFNDLCQVSGSSQNQLDRRPEAEFPCEFIASPPIVVVGLTRGSHHHRGVAGCGCWIERLDSNAVGLVRTNS